MTFYQRLLYHQIHPAKIATDLTAGTLALVLLWRRRPLAGALAVALPSGLSSALLMALADLRPYRDSPAGAYLRRYITPPDQILRLVAYAAMMVAAWRHNRRWLLLGGLSLAACWFYGLLDRR